jgi:hypothetical protein
MPTGRDCDGYMRWRLMIFIGEPGNPAGHQRPPQVRPRCQDGGHFGFVNGAIFLDGLHQRLFVGGHLGIGLEHFQLQRPPVDDVDDAAIDVALRGRLTVALDQIGLPRRAAARGG